MAAHEHSLLAMEHLTDASVNERMDAICDLSRMAELMALGLASEETPPPNYGTDEELLYTILRPLADLTAEVRKSLREPRPGRKPKSVLRPVQPEGGA